VACKARALVEIVQLLPAFFWYKPKLSLHCAQVTSQRK